MKQLIVAILVGIGILSVGAIEAHAEADHCFGVGVHYWQTLDDIDVANIDDSGLAYVFSYQIKPAMLMKFGVELEVLPEDFAGATEPVYAPQAYAFIGAAIYAGIGIGGYYSDGEFADDLFYNLRAGLDLNLLPFIHVDINANYRFNEWDAINNLGENLDTDTITIGASVRLEV